MPNFLKFRIINFLLITLFALSSCKTIENLPGGDARKNPPNPKLRVKKNLEEGRGFRLDNMMGGQAGKGGDFMFASANELWRASLDTLDFMPLSSVNYSGGIIVTDWYSDGNNLDESVKISIRFLTNESKLKKVELDSNDDNYTRKLYADEYFDAENLSLKFHQILSDLSLRQRNIFNMKYFDELKFSEISKITDMNINTIKSIYYSVQKIIKTEIDESTL